MSESRQFNQPISSPSMLRRPPGASPSTSLFGPTTDYSFVPRPLRSLPPTSLSQFNSSRTPNGFSQPYRQSFFTSFPQNANEKKRSSSTANLQASEQPEKRQRTHLSSSPSPLSFRSAFAPPQVSRPQLSQQDVTRNLAIRVEALEAQLGFVLNAIVPSMQQEIAALTEERNYLRRVAENEKQDVAMMLVEFSDHHNEPNKPPQAK